MGLHWLQKNKKTSAWIFLLPQFFRAFTNEIEFIVRFAWNLVKRETPQATKFSKKFAYVQPTFCPKKLIVLFLNSRKRNIYRLFFFIVEQKVVTMSEHYEVPNDGYTEPVKLNMPSKGTVVPALFQHGFFWLQDSFKFCIFAVFALSGQKKAVLFDLCRFWSKPIHTLQQARLACGTFPSNNVVTQSKFWLAHSPTCWVLNLFTICFLSFGA